MHLRWSQISGMPVIDDQTQEIVAFLRDPLIDADSGRVLGFYVLAGSGILLLSTADILSIGTKVHIGSREKLSPPEELVRLQSILDDPRSFLGQTIRNRETGRTLGKCVDLQFDTHHFSIEWLFPRKFLFFRKPIPASEILEVTVDAIWIKNPLRPGEERVDEKAKTAAGLLVAPEPLSS
ncbi:hypothetical protein EXS65_04430 [Candidatus Peribacteria bacterium]|nr:hypothetical protein [Candidatus Peribacteria bacterium]